MNHKAIDIICIGQVLMDCIIRGSGPSGQVISEGTSLPQLPRLAESVTLSPGGDAFNEAVILSRLGHKVGVLCGLGCDLAGDILLGKLRENGVCTEGILQSPAGKTPVAPILVNGDGSRRSIQTLAHQAEFFRPDTSYFQNVRIVSLASLFRPPLTKPEVVLEICRAAKAAGAVLCADTKLAYSDDLTLEAFREALPYIDYIFPNETEAARYTGAKDYFEMARVFLDYGVKNVIIKLGPVGCIAKSAAEELAIPACPVKAVDSTGAGDNFVAGFLSSLLGGLPFREALEFATAAAALSVQAVGATAGVQSRDQVEAFKSFQP